MKYKNYDYAYNHQSRLNTNYADGFGAEILTFNALERVYLGAKSKNQKEHVTKYIWDNLKKFRILSIKSPKRLAYPQFKFDINTPEDYRLIKNFTENFNIKINTKAEDIIKYKLIEKGE